MPSCAHPTHGRRPGSPHRCRRLFVTGRNRCRRSGGPVASQPDFYGLRGARPRPSRKVPLMRPPGKPRATRRPQVSGRSDTGKNRDALAHSSAMRVWAIAVTLLLLAEALGAAGAGLAGGIAPRWTSSQLEQALGGARSSEEPLTAGPPTRGIDAPAASNLTPPSGDQPSEASAGGAADLPLTGGSHPAFDIPTNESSGTVALTETAHSDSPLYLSDESMGHTPVAPGARNSSTLPLPLSSTWSARDTLFPANNSLRGGNAVPLAAEPEYSAYDGVTNLLYVSGGGDEILEVDPSQFTPIGELNVSAPAGDLLYDPSTGQLLVESQGSLLVVDAANGTLAYSINVTTASAGED